MPFNLQDNDRCRFEDFVSILHHSLCTNIFVLWSFVIAVTDAALASSHLLQDIVASVAARKPCTRQTTSSPLSHQLLFSFFPKDDICLSVRFPQNSCMILTTVTSIFEIDNKQSCSINDDWYMARRRCWTADWRWYFSGISSLDPCYCLNKIKYKWIKLKIKTIDKRTKFLKEDLKRIH
jgi:hypothetical protein